MSYTIDRLPNEDIVVGHTLADWDTATEWDPFYEDFCAIFDNAEKPLRYIIVITEFKPTVNDAIAMANMATREAKATLTHPNVAETIIVATNPLIKLSVKGLNSDIFGNINVAVFDTLDRALAHARR